MLVLSRRKQQNLVIDDRITVTVLEVKGKTVRLGIEAPKDVPIRRAELEARPVCRPH
jgi:carbon storage regulator